MVGFELFLKFSESTYSFSSIFKFWDYLFCILFFFIFPILLTVFCGFILILEFKVQFKLKIS